MFYRKQVYKKMKPRSFEIRKLEMQYKLKLILYNNAKNFLEKTRNIRKKCSSLHFYFSFRLV